MISAPPPFRKIDPREYPSRETALAIIEAMKNPAHKWLDVERVTGLDNALYVADLCFMVYGYPELEPVAVSRWVADRFMRPRSPQETQPAKDTTTTPPDRHSYGLGRRS